MTISKNFVRVIISIAVIFGLSAGGVSIAAELGSKEELDLELSPAAGSDANADAVKPVPKKDSPAPAQVPVKKIVAEIPKVAAKKPAVVTTPAIKTYPIKVEDKDKVIPAPKITPKLIEPSKPLVKKEEIKTNAVVAKEVKTQAKDANASGKWFGPETGVEKIDMRRSKAGSLADQKGTGIYTLADCIAIAIKNNIPLQIADKNIKLAQMRIMEARRNMLPSVTIVWEPYLGKVSGRNYAGRKQYIEGKQPMFHGGELYYTLKQAETNLEVTRNEKNKTKNELILQVKKAYYSLAKAESNQVMQRELAGEVGRINQMVNEQYTANVASKLELLNVGSQSSQIKYQLASAEGDVSMAVLMLKQAMNVEPDMAVDIKPDLEFRRIEVSYEDALSAALHRRPEIIMNSLMMEYYMYGKRIAMSHSLPKIDIMGNWGLAKENFTPIDNAFMDTAYGVANNVNITPDEKLQEQWYAGVKGSLPFWGSTAEYTFTREQWVPVVSAFQGTEATTNSYKFKILDNLAMFSDNQLAEVDFDKARQECVKTKQDVTLEVKEQCFNYQKALIQLDTASNKVKYQSSDLEFMKMKRGLDEVPDSNVIESMIKLAQEKFGYVQALADCHTSIASINKAIGDENYYKDQ